MMITIQIMLRTAVGATQVAQCERTHLPMQETRVQSLGQEDPGRRKTQPTPVSLVGNPMDRGAWQAAVPWGHEV